MHIAFTVPLWAMIGFGTVAYPSIGALISSFLMRASQKRLPGMLIFAAGSAWPVTLGVAVAAFPVWLAIWLVRNYGQAVQATLRGNGKAMSHEVVFEYNTPVSLVKPFNGWGPGTYGVVKDTKSGMSFVEFTGLGSQWVQNGFLVRT